MATDVLSTVERMLGDRGTASLDEKTNSIIVTDVPSIIEEIAKVLPQLDRETKQVTIKSRLVFIDAVDLNQLGVSWKVGDMNNPRVDVHGEASTDGARLSDPFLQLALGTIRSGVNVTGLLQALQEKQLVDVQAQPQITTLDNLQAEVFVGERTPIRVLDVGAETEAAATIQLIETGIRLTVTPHITNNMVNDGQTAVIGGLTTQDSVENLRSVPYLSSIPLIGRLFRFKSVSTEKKDLLILVTPYIVSDLAENIE
jgi:type IV pilus assembly protein PilQ